MTERNYSISLTLASDGAFGRGDGVAGWVDQEVQHDEYGCPYLGGKTIKGILVNECADILAAMPAAMQSIWTPIALAMFGQPGSLLIDQARLSIGDAVLPEPLRRAIRNDLDSSHPSLTPLQVLTSLTTLRRQTAMNPQTGAPEEHTLRTTRVIIRGTSFVAPLWLSDPAAEEDDSAPAAEKLLMLLAATVKAFRRAGTARNRGYGRLKEVQLCDAKGTSITQNYFEQFCREVG